ncbi:hypothetical protein Tco_0699804, partial [Tanacetum coccineum]
MGFDLTKSDLCPSFVKDLTAKGGGLRVVNTYIGSHREDEMDFRSFMMEGVDGEFNFLPEGGLDEEGNSPSTRIRGHVFLQKPLERENTLLIVRKRDLTKKPKGCRPKQVKLPAMLLTLLMWITILTFMVVAHVTPLSWKQHLKEISLEKLCDIHDRAYMRQVVLDNTEVAKDKAYAKLERKCNKALQDLEKNALVLDMRSEMRLCRDRLTNSIVIIVDSSLKRR